MASASIVINNFDDFVKRCKEIIINDINWEATILKVLFRNSEFVVRSHQVVTTDERQEEANPAAANTSSPSESTTSSFEMSLLLHNSSEENLDNEIEAQLSMYDVKYNHTDVEAIDEREEEVETQERSPDYLRSQSLIRNEEILPSSVQEEEPSSEQMNGPPRRDFENSRIENQGREENLEEYENISYFIPEIEIGEDPIDPIGDIVTQLSSVSKMNSKTRKQQQTSLDHNITANADVSYHISPCNSRQNHKDCTPGETMEKSSRRPPCNKKDNTSTLSKKSIKKRIIGEVVQSDMNKLPRKKLRVNFTDIAETRKVPQVQQAGPYVSLPRLSKVDVLETVRSLRQKTYMSITADKPDSSSSEGYRCTLCSQRLKSKCGLLRHHIYRHTEERPYTCLHCPKSYKCYSDMKQHTRNVHKPSRSYNMAPSKNSRINFTGEKKKKVSQVEEAGPCLSASHSPKEVDPLKRVCSLRPRNSRNSISADYAGSTVAGSKNLEVHTDDSSKNYCTDESGKNVESLVSNKNSTRIVEETNKRQENELAPELEKENLTTDSNGSSHTKGYCCRICHLWLKYKGSLRRHVMYQHTNQSKPFKCPYCPGSYVDSYGLRKHIESSVHRSIRS